MFSMFFLLIATLTLRSVCRDEYFSRGNFGVSAQKMDYTNNRLAISRNTDDTILIYTAGSSTVYRTISGIHKADVKTIAFNSAGTQIASGGQDFIVNIYTLSTSTYNCKFTDIHGMMEELIWLSDNVRVVGVTDTGIIYVWNATSCGFIAKRTFSGQRFKSVIQRIGGNQLWVANYESTIYRLNYDLSNSGATFTVPSRRLVSLIVIPSTTYQGACTQQGFYLYNGLTLVHTRNHLSSPTTRCRVSPLYTTYAGWTQGYFITATSGYRQLWSIWKLQLSPIKTWLIRVQPNDNRHGSIMPHTAQLSYYQFDTIEVVSSSANSQYLQSGFLDTTTTMCDIGTLPSKRIYNQWQCTLCVDIVSNEACYDCTTDYDCSTCYANYYYESASKDCIRCPEDCYTCSSPTACLTCHTNLMMVSGTCVTCNISSPNCVNCYVSGSTVLCQKCLEGYYTVSAKGCERCNLTMPNCLECIGNATCTLCETSYKLLSTFNGCEPCSLYMVGCMDCVATSYCDACNPATYPYYRTVSATERYCQNLCYYKCKTCSYNYNDCATCDTNRTRAFVNASVGYTCNCNSGYLQYTTTMACTLCSDIVTNCQVCSNTTYCSTCKINFYFNPGVSGYRSCQACNYSCGACSSSGNYYDCTSCIGLNNRVLSSSRCICTSLQYYEVANTAACLACSVSITNCLTCYNGSFCLTCILGFYIRNISPGNQDCQPCNSRCLSCSQAANYCTSCYIGQYRQFNLPSHSCQCLKGYFQTGANICQKCSDYLGACVLCTNGTVCTKCTNNNFFEIDGTKTVCGKCHTNCQNCNTWTNICSNCSVTAFRTLNTITSTCDCIDSYAENNGVCLNCNLTFPGCTSCNSTHCLGCETGFALSQTQSQCLNCSYVLIGCLICTRGFCSMCNSSAGFVKAYTKCICGPGYYFFSDNRTCLPYGLGASIKRSFSLTTLFKLEFQHDNRIVLTTIFAVKKVSFPLGISRSIKLFINEEQISSSRYSIAQTSNNTLSLYYQPLEPISKAMIVLQYLEDTVYDEKQYQPTRSMLIQRFQKNLYASSKYSKDILRLADAIRNYATTGVRYFFSAMVVLGSMDIAISLSTTYQIMPLYLLLGITVPGEIDEVLKAMIEIHRSSLFIFPYCDQVFRESDQSSNAYLNQYHLGNSLFHSKHIDLIFLAFVILIYGIVGSVFLECMNKGKRYKLWYGKFVERRYSTLSITVLSLLVPFVTAAVIDYYSRSYSPGYDVDRSVPSVSGYLILTGAVLVPALFFIFIFTHVNFIGLMRLKEGVKTEDCYFGMSKIDGRCDQYVLSELLYWIFVPLSVLYLHGMAVLIIAILLILWNLSFYRHWILFPSKVVYFCRLLSQVGTLLFTSVFLVFYLSENFLQIQPKLLVAVGYLAVSGLGLSVGLNIALAVVLLAQTIVRLCKTNNSLIQSLAQQAHARKNSLVRVQNLRGKSKVVSTKSIMPDDPKVGEDKIAEKNIFGRNQKFLVQK